MKRVTLEEVNRKLDIILGVLVDPNNLEAVKQGHSLEKALMDEAIKLTRQTGDHKYIVEAQKARVARRQAV